MSSATWATPVPVSDLELAFGGARATERLMPTMAEIPEEFTSAGNRWVALQQTWFFRGLKNARWTPRPGIETGPALRHLKAIQASFDPKHEHKEASVAYLLSLWFEDVTYEAAK